MVVGSAKSPRNSAAITIVNGVAHTSRPEAETFCVCSNWPTVTKYVCKELGRTIETKGRRANAQVAIDADVLRFRDIFMTALGVR
jgi:hypothetical protein